MSFLSRSLLVVGLSSLLTLALMVVFWEPVPPPAESPAIAPAEPMPPATQAPPPADVQPVRLSSVRDNEGADWVMSHPENVDGLTPEIRTTLFDAGCTIPTSGDRTNVITGALREPGMVDLAVLCVRDNRAAVYVFWGGQPGEPDVSSEDEYVPGTYIRTAAVADIRADVENSGAIDPGMPRRITHDGIALGQGCCATTQYWHRGRWRFFVTAN
jgi:hypothetical protein